MDHALFGTMDTIEEREKIAVMLLEDREAREIGNSLVAIARKESVSDIHLDEVGERVRVRWRRDGLMENVAVLPEEKGKLIARYFKVSAGLPPVTAEMPGEGFFDASQVDGSQVSIRVSSIRGSSGTKTSLRILDRDSGLSSLSRLGLEQNTAEWIEEWAEFGNGMLLVTGPTGSGKTTTLYTLLERLETHPLNLVSIEDPVERMIGHVTQVDLSLEHELDIVSGMRALLRHDPDIIFVGELRDAGVARAAVQAAFSGHVVVATMHSKDPVGAVTRLRGFGIENHEIAASLSGVLGQQLVRKKDEGEKWLSSSERKWLEAAAINGFDDWEVREDGGHRYEGRTGVFEWWQPDEGDYYSILDGEDERTIRTNLRKRGLKSLLESGKALVHDGVSTVEEIRRLS